MKKILFLLLLAVACHTSYSQIDFQKWCIVGDSSSISKPGNVINSPGSTTLIDPNGVVIIPVVFHVLYDINHPNRNIPDNLIHSQIERLNEDFRNNNADGSSVPQVWQDLRADTKIEFKLACIKPDGSPTNGIVRKLTTVVDFPTTGYVMEAKLSSTGGDDAWPTNTYLNVWVCGIEDGFLGYATLPWDYGGFTFGISNYLLDGIVLRYDVVGNNNGNPSGFNLGRIANHEAGHWLGLFHLYQGTPNCTPGDLVADTPPQNSFYDHCPTGTQRDDCSPIHPGNMYMNYMSLVDDPCRLLFTTGQKDRMRSYIAAPGPNSRYPFISNYFGILRFTSPHIVQNNMITVHLKNPACIGTVSYSYTGPVTEVSHDDHQIIFSVTCPSSGTVSLTATAANYTDNFTFDFTNTSGCPTELWPKVYSGKAPVYLGKDQNGNLFLQLHELDFLTPNTNHVGVLPLQPCNTCDFTFHYTLSGITNWTKTNVAPLFVLNNGSIQMNDYTYFDGSSGNIVAPPSLVPTGETIIAETSNGGFITKTSDHIYVHSSTGTSSVFDAVDKTIFNPTTNKLFVINMGGIVGGFKEYDLVGNNLLLVVNNTFPTNYYDNITQIDNQDRVYIVKNNILQEYDYVNNLFNPININGFLNVSVFPTISYNRYTEDRTLVVQKTQNKIYAIDFSTMTQKSITAINLAYDYFIYCYFFIGNNVYLSGKAVNNTLILGTQNIVPLPPWYNSIFLTKLNLLSDFTFGPIQTVTQTQKSTPFQTTISPNPVADILRINTTENLKQNGQFYSISIIDQMANRVIRKDQYQPGSDLNISGLRPGVYYLEITNIKGEKSGMSFYKL